MFFALLLVLGLFLLVGSIWVGLVLLIDTPQDKEYRRVVQATKERNERWG